MDKRNNAFDLLRIILSLSVLVSHAYLIGGHGRDPLEKFSKNQTNFGEVAVIGFFALSGYLITASFLRSENTLSFISARLLRIMPGFWFCLIFTSLILAPLLYYSGYKTITDYKFTGSESALSYIIDNSLLSIRQWSIKGLLDHSFYKESFNGSLWTLFPEFQCYIFTFTAGLFGMLQKSRLPIFFMLVYVFYVINVVLKINYGPTIFILSPAFKLYTAYLCGTLFFLYRDHLTLTIKGFIFSFIFYLMLMRFGGYTLAAPILITQLLLNAFSAFAYPLKYDISYGLYIYAFPVEQLIFNVLGHRLSFLACLLITVGLVVILAFFSFFVIEKPFLSLKKYFHRKKLQL